jgi:hypothetical protein
VLFRILRGRGRPLIAAAGGALLFFANPVSVLVSSRRGMFDGVAILFLMLALGVGVAGASASRGRASAWMSVSLLVKHVAWFHPLLLVDARKPRTLAAAALPYAVFAASLTPFLRSWPQMRTNVLEYRSLAEGYGTDFLRSLSFLPPWTPAAVFVAAALAAAAWLGARRVELGRASLFLFLVVLVFAPGVTPYYFVWPIALGALYPTAGFAVYTAVVTLFYLRSPDVVGLDWPHLPGWGGIWFAAAFWALWEVRALTARAAPRAEISARAT